jgi:hypothetical protein
VPVSQPIMSDPQETRATGQEPSSQSLFLQLPRELRTEVYRELLRSEEELGLGVDHLWVPRIGGNGLHPGILQTCKQVHGEAADVLYGENFFLDVLNLNPDNRNLSRVRRILVFIDVEDHVVAMTKFLDEHPNVTHLFLHPLFSGEVDLMSFEEPIQRHRSLINLKISDIGPVSQDFIDCCWRLFSYIRRNQTAGAGVRLEEVELYDTTVCPFFLTVKQVED